MEDTLLKTVRITDNIKLEVYQQGKRRKYALFPGDSKSEKYDVAMSDDDVIKEAIAEYGPKNGKARYYYKVIQDPYKDPLPVRTYGGGAASPYYLNNGCKLNILWVGRTPNPDFILGTYSNPEDASDAPGSPKRYLSDQVITSSNEDANKTEFLPKSTWVVSGTFSDYLGSVYGPDYRDVAQVSHKVLTIIPPESSKEDYFVWSNNGLVYSKNILPAGTQREVTVLVNGRPQTGYTRGNFAENFSSDWEDSQILGKVLIDYKVKVEKLHGIPSPDYKLALCSPDSEACSVIEYKSPVKGLDPKPTQDIPPVPSPTQSVAKIKMTIDGLPKDLQIKAKENLPTFTIWTGDIPKVNNGTGNIDDYEDGLGEEYSETSFAGSEEEKITQEKITQLNAIDDNPTGPSPVDGVGDGGSVDKSSVGGGPITGSKLTTNGGTYMVNLAGHRLKNIIKDLQSYLRKNGYPDAVIGNNGIMRDIQASAYPSSPLRAAASLHGAGLAIDLTFKISGFKWSGIGDNGNLAKDSNLTKVISNFVKGQGDITWGASWGKGSKPTDGIVNARGVDEYHHMEIRADLIPGYWEPVKDELAKFGFKPTDLKSPGRGSNLHKLMLKLLGDKSV